jgi:hypothetical protein
MPTPASPSASPAAYDPSKPEPSPEAAPPVRPRADSHVRVRPATTGFAALARGQLAPTRREAQPHLPSCLEDLASEQQALGEALRNFDLDAMDLPRDPSVHAAAQSMTDRLADLGELRSALGAVYLDATDPRMQQILQLDSPLSEYLRGLYTWCRGVLRAFVELGHGLRALDPDWSLLRSRLDDARAFYLEELEGQIQLEVGRLRLHFPTLHAAHDPLAELDAHLAELFWAAAHLGRGLDKRFG